MALSLFDTIMQLSGIPALEKVFGVPAVHTNDSGDEISITVIKQMELIPVGDFGERMEERTVIELSNSYGAMIGNTFSIESEPTIDDPFPEPKLYKATQVLSNDGYMTKFAVLEVV